MKKQFLIFGVAVLLICVGLNGCNEQKTIENKPPTAYAYAEKIEVMANEKVHFYGNGSDPDGGNVTYQWNLQPGVWSNEQNPTHIYRSCMLSPGLYTVILTVTDDEGGKATDTINITVWGLKMTVLDVEDYHPYINKIKLKIKVEVGFDFRVQGCYELETENGLIYTTCTGSAEHPDKILTGETATWWVYFKDMPNVKGIKLYWYYLYKDSYPAEAIVPEY